MDEVHPIAAAILASVSNTWVHMPRLTSVADVKPMWSLQDLDGRSGALPHMRYVGLYVGGCVQCSPAGAFVISELNLNLVVLEARLHGLVIHLDAEQA